MLPESLRDWIEDVAERMQTPMDYPAACAVVALAGSVNRRVRIQPKETDSGWIVTPNLWGAIVGPPGVMKTPVVHAMVNPLERIEKEWRETYESDLEAYQAEAEKYELDVAIWKEAYKRAARPDKKPEKKPEKIPERPKPTAVEPHARRLVVNDATFEALHTLMVTNQRGLLLLRDELTGWLASLDRQGREGERAFCLECWDGDRPFSMERIGRGSIYVPACCLSLFGGIQPARLRTYLVDALQDGPANDGLIQRFSVIVWPDIPRTWQLIDRLPNAQAQARAARVFWRLATLESENVPILKFAPDAQEMFNDWWTKLEIEFRSGELHPAMVAHLAKYKKLVPALALIFELSDWVATDKELLPETISLDHAKQGAAFASNFLRSHAARMYSCITTPQLRAARELGQKLAQGTLTEIFSVRDVYFKGWTGLGTPDEVRSALELLADSHWVRVLHAEPSPFGGRRPERFKINPGVKNE
jgi:putative DNA primase/helicase